MKLDDPALDQLFRTARTHNKWTEEPVTDEEIQAVFDLMKMAPTSANCSPARFLFLRSVSSKERLRPALSAGNVDKTVSAPVTAIVAYDPHFYEQLPKLFPHADARAWFSTNPPLAEETAFRNSTLQGGYFILAARALGLDCGPMSGFDKAKVDAEFFSYRGWKANFLINIGHGDPSVLFDRAPRFDFSEVADIL